MTVVGVLVGTSYLVGQEAVTDGLTAAISAAALVTLTAWKRFPEPAIIAVAGAIGLIAYPLVHTV